MEVLAGGGPSDVVELTLALAREMLELAGLDDADPADALADGRAMDAWRAMVQAQGGDPAQLLPRATEVEVVTAPATGTLARLDAMAVGIAAWRLGAGRPARRTRSPPPPAWCGAPPGDAVTEGQPLLELHLDDPDRLPSRARGARRRHRGQPRPRHPPPLVLGRVG